MGEGADGDTLEAQEIKNGLGPTWKQKPQSVGIKAKLQPRWNENACPQDPFT